MNTVFSQYSATNKYIREIAKNKLEGNNEHNGQN